MARKKVKKTTKKTRAKAPIDKLSNRQAYVVSYSRNGKRIRSRAIFRKKTDANKFAKKIQDNEKKNIRVVMQPWQNVSSWNCLKRLIN